MGFKIKFKPKQNSKASMLVVNVFIILFVLGIIGEVMCVYKFATSDFKPSYSREIIYGFGTVTGIGGIIGWFDFEDTPTDEK